jgi:hypothetical protein
VIECTFEEIYKKNIPKIIVKVQEYLRSENILSFKGESIIIQLII